MLYLNMYTFLLSLEYATALWVLNLSLVAIALGKKVGFHFKCMLTDTVWRAARNHLEGHMRPAGRVFETPYVGYFNAF